MSKVLVGFDLDLIRKALDGDGGNYKVIIFNYDERKDSIKSLISEYNLTELDSSSLLSGFNGKFKNEYLKLVEALGVRYNSKAWWATWISSKNRFCDKLFGFVYSFAKIVHLYKIKKWEKLLLISPPMEVLNSLRKFCNKHEIQFKVLGDTSTSKLKHLSVYFRFFNNFIEFFGRVYPRVIISKKKFSRKMAEVLRKEGKYFLIKTFVHGQSFSKNGEYLDTYFGVLPDYLKEKGKKIIIVGALVGNFKKIISKICQSDRILVVPEEYFLDSIGIIKAFLGVIITRIKIRNQIFFDGLDITEIIEDCLTNEFLNNMVSHFCSFEIARSIAKKINLETVLITHENNPWEKMYIMALRKYSPNTVILGYQHAPITPSHLCLALKGKEREIVPLPDKIVTSGGVNRDLLIKYGGYEREKVVIGCALKQSHLFVTPKRRAWSNNIRHILVGLEGVLESVELMDFVFDALKDKTNYIVKFRAHPLLPLAVLETKTKFRLNGRLFHFERSQNLPLLEDFQWADLIIYSGSTIALEALMYGIPIINVDIGHVLNTDPCFECTHFKKTVSTPEELVEAIQYFSKLDEGEALIEQKLAQEYVSKYFYPPTEEDLRSFIDIN